MTTFHSTFYDLRGVTPLVATAARDLFEGYARGAPDSDGGGAFDCTIGDVRLILICVYHPAHGVALTHDRHDPSRRETDSLLSVHDAQAMARFVETDQDAPYPLGAFLPAGLAYRVVEDFFADPTTPSPRVDWVSADQVSWPSP